MYSRGIEYCLYYHLYYCNPEYREFTKTQITSVLPILKVWEISWIMSYKSSNGDLLVIKMKINKKEQNFKAKQNKQKTSSKKNNP